MKKVGTQIRTERRAAGLSLRELAGRIGISAMTLQRIETDKTSPSVSVLAEIASHLRRPIDFFLKEKISITRREEQPTIESAKMKLVLFAPMGVVAENVAVNMVEAQEGRVIDAHTEEGYALVYMLEGEALFEHDGTEYILRAGDSLYYNARFSHSLTCIGGKHKAVSIFINEKR